MNSERFERTQGKNTPIQCTEYQIACPVRIPSTAEYWRIEITFKIDTMCLVWTGKWSCHARYFLLLK
jgi:hypothetical protein